MDSTCKYDVTVNTTAIISYGC